MSINVHEFTDENFDTDVTQSELPVLIDFWAVWCGPCKAIAPVIEEIAGEYEGQVKVGKVDVDQNKNTAMKFGVRSIPTLLVIKDGEVVNQIVGAVPKGNITNILKEVIQLITNEKGNEAKGHYYWLRTCRTHCSNLFSKGKFRTPCI